MSRDNEIITRFGDRDDVITCYSRQTRDTVILIREACRVAKDEDLEEVHISQEDNSTRITIRVLR